jgi:hypothetical protein
MGRGLSDLQKRILEALKDGTKIDRRYFSHLVYGSLPTKVMIVSLSRAIPRLHNRGLIDLYAVGFHLDPCPPGMPLGGFVRSTIGGGINDIQITSRGAAYLRGEKLPPLELVFKQSRGKCWCGADVYENKPNEVKMYYHHQLLPSKWRTEAIG